MSASSFDQFLREYPLVTFDKGQTILLRDSPPAAVHVVESGFVKTYTITGSGDERLISIEGKGEDLPVGYAFGLIERSQYFYEAYTRCKIRMVPRREFVAHLEHDSESLERRHIRLIIVLLATMSRVEALEQPRARDKIAATLMYMTERVGVQLRAASSPRIRLTMTQQEIANLLGLTRETTGAGLKNLELRNILTHSRNNYILYLERLRSYLESGDR